MKEEEQYNRNNTIGTIQEEQYIGKTQLHWPDIGRKADDWAIVSVSALYNASTAACAGNTRLRM